MTDSSIDGNLCTESINGIMVGKYSITLFTLLKHINIENIICNDLVVSFAINRYFYSVFFS